MENNTEEIKLMQFAHGAGCGCKISPQVLDEILKNNSSKGFSSFPNLLIGNANKDDAAVYQLNDKEALISTTDFFTPIVNDPYIFGQIAAANAISDVYAMGGKPIMALAILGWPINKLSTDIAGKVIEGAEYICEKAGIPIAGGHSIDTPEPIFGLSVNGLVPIKHLKPNNQAQEGDILFLTKPIGIGVLSTAMKREVIETEDLETLYKYTTQLNNIGVQLAEIDGVHAMTDVTGFGLAGHLIEMAEGSGLSAILEYQQMPKVHNVEKYLAKNVIPDATYRNWKSYGEKIKIEKEVNYLQAFQLLPDPQTNGGLLISVHPEQKSVIENVLKQNGYQDFTKVIGRFIKKEDKVLFVQ